MRLASVGIGSALLFSLFSAEPADAQRVSADIRIGGVGPVSGHIRIGDRYDWRRDRYRPRRIVVEHFGRRDRGWYDGWFRNWRRGAEVVILFYDPYGRHYYDRHRPGLQQVRIYRRGGKHYRVDDDRWDRDDRYDRDDRGRDRRYDRDGRDDRNDRDRDRFRDRRDDRRDDRRYGGGRRDG
jgi:hypothetical protein